MSLPSPFRFSADAARIDVHVILPRDLWFRFMTLLPDKGDIAALFCHAAKAIHSESLHLPVNDKSNPAELLAIVKRITNAPTALPPEPNQPGLRRDALCGPGANPARPDVGRTNPILLGRDPGQGRQPSQAPSGDSEGKR